MLQPRLAMTAAMAFFSIALTLNLTGVRLTDLRASDLKPSSIMRSASQAKASVVRYTDNLRVVYELESRVRDLQRSSDDNGSTSTPAPQNDPRLRPATQQSKIRSPDSPETRPETDQAQPRFQPPRDPRRQRPVGRVRSHLRPCSPFSSQAFVVLNPSVFKQEGGLV